MWRGDGLGIRFSRGWSGRGGELGWGSDGVNERPMSPSILLCFLSRLEKRASDPSPREVLAPLDSLPELHYRHPIGRPMRPFRR